MRLQKRINTVTPSWFYTDTPWYLKLVHIYVRGDIFVLLPLVGILLLSGFFSLKWMIVFFCVYIAVRQFGEMIYWLLQQFGDKKFRPYDYGLKQLGNNEIYIIYQTTSLALCVLSACAVLVLLQ